jgi:hypothetical protein
MRCSICTQHEYPELQNNEYVELLNNALPILKADNCSFERGCTNEYLRNSRELTSVKFVWLHGQNN